MTVSNANVLRVVEVDAVAIADLQVVQQVDAIDDSLVAANQMHRPISALLDRHVADSEIGHIRQGQHMRTRVECLVGKGLQFIRVRQFGTHEGDAVAMNGTLTRNADVLGILSPKPQHTLTAILTECTQLIDRLIGIGFQCGCGL